MPDTTSSDGGPSPAGDSASTDTAPVSTSTPPRGQGDPAGFGQEAGRTKTTRTTPTTNSTNEQTQPPSQASVATVQSDAPKASGELEEFLVPFEWFDRTRMRWNSAERQRFAAVLILWLDESRFGEHPLLGLQELLQQIKPGSLIHTSGFTPPEVYVVGPRTSTTLINMLKECDDEGACKAPELRGLTFRSPWVTASSSVLERVVHGKQGSRKQESRKQSSSLYGPSWTLHGDHGPTFERGTTADDVLLRAVTKELETRGAIPVPETATSDQAPETNAHVVLLAEWDTVYGRALPITLRDTQSDRNGIVFHYRTYMRGVDGVLPWDPRLTKREDQQSADHPSDPLTGRSQLDYVRRLSQELMVNSSRVRISNLGWKPERVTAIGVLGSDVYDKLLLMRALRPYFTHSHFFTTDLDVRLLNPSEASWCRNLIVVSGFGLRGETGLNDGGGAPYFRNSYQAATFDTCLRALGMDPNRGSEKERPNWGPHRAQVFEVARSGAYQLAEYDDKLNRFDLPRDRRGAPAPTFPLLLTLGAIAIALLLLMLLFVERWWDGGLGWASNLLHVANSWWRLAILASISVLALVILYDRSNPYGEPFVVFEGISTWPTAVLRLGASILAVYLIRKAFQDVRASVDRVSARYQLGTGTAPRVPHWGQATCGIAGTALILIAAWTLASGGDGFACLLLFILGVIGVNAYPLDRFVRLDLNFGAGIGTAWGAYTAWSRRRSSFVRASCYTLLYLAAAVPFFMLFEEPSSPTRGPWNSAFYGLTLAAAVILQTVLIFVVIDATRGCILFINYLHRRDPLSPDRRLLAELGTVQSQAANQQARVIPAPQRWRQRTPWIGAVALCLALAGLALATPGWRLYALPAIAGLILAFAYGEFCVAQLDAHEGGNQEDLQQVAVVHETVLRLEEQIEKEEEVANRLREQRRSTQIFFRGELERRLRPEAPAEGADDQAIPLADEATIALAPAAEPQSAQSTTAGPGQVDSLPTSTASRLTAELDAQMARIRELREELRRGGVRELLLQGERSTSYYILATQLVARHTRVVGNLIYYPFILLLLMMVARHSVFDNYDWPPSLVVIFLVGFGLATACGLGLRVAAERMRGTFLGRLEHELAVRSALREEQKELEVVARTREAIQTEQGGSFGPFAQNPVLRALLIPLGGIGSISAVELILAQVFK